MNIFKKHISFLLEGMVDMLSTKFWMANVRSMAKEVQSELEVFEGGKKMGGDGGEQQEAGILMVNILLERGESNKT